MSINLFSNSLFEVHYPLMFNFFLTTILRKKMTIIINGIINRTRDDVPEETWVCLCMGVYVFECQGKGT